MEEKSAISTLEGNNPLLPVTEPVATPAIVAEPILLTEAVADDHRAFLARRRFASLDGLRCVAILGVLLHHCWHGSPLIPLLNRGFLGVDLFFVLSGFLIVTLLLRERDRTGSIALGAFYIRRSLRIFPVYFGLLAALAVIFTLKPRSTEGPAFFRALPALTTYTTDFFEVSSFMVIAWSLAAEEQFYLFWPPIQKMLRPRHALAALAALIAVNQLVNFGLADRWLGAARNLNIFQITFTPILLGVSLAYLLHHRPSYAMIRRLLGHALAPVAMVVAIIAVAILPGGLAAWQRLALHLLMMALLAACVMREDHALARPLTWAPIQRIGTVSYGMYLFHVLALSAVIAGARALRLDSGLITFAATAVLTYGLAELSFRFYETPFLSLKKRVCR